MYQTYWGLNQKPFTALGDDWLATDGQREALARLSYLVDERHRLGLVLGPAGSGKSLLLDRFADQFRSVGCQVARVDLLGREPRELLWLLAAGWGVNPDSSWQPFELWRALTDRLVENRWQQAPTIALIDDADEAMPDTLTQVVRLIHGEPADWLTVVLTCRADRVAHLGQRLLELAELRIDLGSWDLAETREYVERSLLRAGRKQPAFSGGAIERLHELSGGIARRVGMLAEVSLVAAAGGQLPLVDVFTVEQVHDELGVSEALSPLTFV
jgi:general secretion pathway protein A